MRQSMKGDDGGRIADKNKVTRNPSYDKKRDTEAGVQKRLSELVRDHCSSHVPLHASRLTARQHAQDKSGKDRIMSSSDDKKRLIEECAHRQPLPRHVPS